MLTAVKGCPPGRDAAARCHLFINQRQDQMFGRVIGLENDGGWMNLEASDCDRAIAKLQDNVLIKIKILAVDGRHWLVFRPDDAL